MRLDWLAVAASVGAFCLLTGCETGQPTGTFASDPTQAKGTNAVHAVAPAPKPAAPSKSAIPTTPVPPRAPHTADSKFAQASTTKGAEKLMAPNTPAFSRPAPKPAPAAQPAVAATEPTETKVVSNGDAGTALIVEGPHHPPEERQGGMGKVGWLGILFVVVCVGITGVALNTSLKRKSSRHRSGGDDDLKLPPELEMRETTRHP